MRRVTQRGPPLVLLLPLALGASAVVWLYGHFMSAQRKAADTVSLELYAILPLEPEPSVWSRLRRLVQPTTSPQDLVSSVRLAPDGRLIGFHSTVALYNHAQLSAHELQRFLSHQLRTVAAKAPQALRRRIAAVSVAAKERLRHLSAEMKTMAHETGILKRKRQALFQLKNKVRRAIDRNQNGGNCSRALVCRLSNPYGFSSAIHDVLWCLAQGVSQGRPVLVDSQPWHYAPSAWHEAFQPLSFTCPSRTEPRSQWPGENLSANRAALLELPRDVADPLVELHGDPYAWWFGQLMAYIMRPSKRLLELISQAKRKLQFQSPIVGLHVRRTDKESEASFHESEEYMEHAEAFFAAAGPHVPRRVFVATDEPDVFHELRHRFANYSFVGDEAASAAAREPRTRYSLRSLLPLARDVLLLSECDLVVCTLSSGVCRVVYELMQARRTDASAHLVSLDVDYFYAFVQFPARRVIYSHRPLHPKELWLREGDAVERLGDHSVIGEARRKKFLDGVSVGTLPGTVLTGLYPTYKAVPQLRVAASKLTS
ncbi:alpha-(1,6)-fucosyltransferase [Dermacentor silvarum]|uniref:alpha-(1,6)-fucosyltransferase n=1 Tax=Dermacentor silvarum TaxID=543639 RepID=UPI002100CD57|nr:alpha-(1,6)-fucosyltransferase [Dermacentor silvarum]